MIWFKAVSILRSQSLEVPNSCEVCWQGSAPREAGKDMTTGRTVVGMPYGVVAPTLGTVLVVESRSSPKGEVDD